MVFDWLYNKKIRNIRNQILCRVWYFIGMASGYPADPRRRLFSSRLELAMQLLSFAMQLAV
jgi:hypothetical protein